MKPSCRFTRSKLAILLQPDPVTEGSRYPVLSGATERETITIRGNTNEEVDVSSLPLLGFHRTVRYSTIRSIKSGISVSRSISITRDGPACIHSKHPTQRSRLMIDFFEIIEIEDFRQTFIHLPNPIQVSPRGEEGHYVVPAFPRVERKPIARFLIAPPNPETIWL